MSFTKKPFQELDVLDDFLINALGETRKDLPGKRGLKGERKQQGSSGSYRSRR